MNKTEPVKRGRGRPRKEGTDPMPKKTRPVPQETVPGPKETPALSRSATEKALAATKKRHVGNPAFTGDAITATAAENAMFIQQSLELFNLPKIDLADADAVAARINQYFSIIGRYGNKPTVAGLGLALNGMDRQTLWEIRTGNYRFGKIPYDLPTKVSDLIKNTYKMMEEMWENYMQQGKINPVSGIFLGKNNYGYQDKTEYIVTPNTQASDFSEKQLLDRYGIDSEFDSDSDSVSDS